MSRVKTPMFKSRSFAQKEFLLGAMTVSAIVLFLSLPEIMNLAGLKFHQAYAAYSVSREDSFQDGPIYGQNLEGEQGKHGL